MISAVHSTSRAEAEPAAAQDDAEAGTEAGNAEAEVEPECLRTPLQHIAQTLRKNHNKAEPVSPCVGAASTCGGR